MDEGLGLGTVKEHLQRTRGFDGPTTFWCYSSAWKGGVRRWCGQGKARRVNRESRRARNAKKSRGRPNCQRGKSWVYIEGEKSGIGCEAAHKISQIGRHAQENQSPSGREQPPDKE